MKIINVNLCEKLYFPKKLLKSGRCQIAKRAGFWHDESHLRNFR